MSVAAGEARLSLTAFLLRSSVAPLSALTPTSLSIASPQLWRNGALTGLDAPPSAVPPNDEDVVLVLLSKTTGPPRWQHFIEDGFGLSGFAAPVSQSLGAMVFCPVHDPLDRSLRWNVWVFGSGSRALRRGSVDPRFGLLTALNRISAQPGGDVPSGRLRQFRYQQFGAYRQRTSHSASRDTPLEGFRFDQHTDLLAGAGGPRSDADGHVYGARQIRVREDLTGPNDLLHLAQDAMDDYRQHAYENDFSFIDDYVPVDDDLLLTRLRIELFADVRAGNDNVDAFIPDDLVDLEDERAIQFILFPGEQTRGASRVNLTLAGVSAKVQDADEAALDWTLRFCDSDKAVVAEATLLDCLSADISLGSDRFLISDGTFFAVRQEFIAMVDDTIQDLTHTSISLPCYRGGDEGDWNSSVAAGNPEEFVCLDGSLVRLQGETPFEPADLAHVSGSLIHAKRKGRSSALSHLFVQARRSCQLLSQVPAACDQLRDLVQARASSPEFGERMRDALAVLDDRPFNVEVALAFLGDWRGRDAKNLPLLAKLEMVEATRAMGLYGFNPTIALVDLCL